MTPRILLNRLFPFADIGVETGEPEWRASPSYDRRVGAAWTTMLAGARHPLWDGIYYRVANTDDLLHGPAGFRLRLGTVRYRYIATFPGLEGHHAADGLDPLYHLSTTALVRTRDGHYLFGRRRNGRVDLIGGGVQPDELPVAGGSDIEANLVKEMREEAAIGADDILRMTGIGVALASTSNILIVGHADLALSLAEARDRFETRADDEMAGLVDVPAASLEGVLSGLGDFRPLIALLGRPGQGGNGDVR